MYSMVRGFKRFFETTKTVNPVDNVFRLSEYDCIGFDLDNTLSEYKLYELAKLEYDILAKYLINTKKYDPEFLQKPFAENISFIRRGLILDIHKGNILDIAIDGKILKASHGSRMMDTLEIGSAYEGSVWDVTSRFVQDYLDTWNGPMSTQMRALLDYFDISVSLLFARAVDDVDSKNGGPLELYTVWDDIISGLWYMFDKEKFQNNEGEYFPALKKNPEKYIKKCPNEVVEWLKKIKQSDKLTFLITGSNADYANFVAENSIGKNWKEYFDVIVYYAKKPGFFVSARPFREVINEQEGVEIPSSDLKLGGEYSQGNWASLLDLFKKTSSKDDLKCVYIGDNMVQDIYSPTKVNIDTVAVVYELKAENNLDVDDLDVACAVSSVWGSYFADPVLTSVTVWGGIIYTYSRICIPELTTLANKPLTYGFPAFMRGTVYRPRSIPVDGYYPEPPPSIGF